MTPSRAFLALAALVVVGPACAGEDDEADRELSPILPSGTEAVDATELPPAQPSRRSMPSKPLSAVVPRAPSSGPAGGGAPQPIPMPGPPTRSRPDERPPLGAPVGPPLSPVPEAGALPGAAPQAAPRQDTVQDDSELEPR